MPPAMLEELITKEHETDKIWSKSAAALKILKQGQEPSGYLPFKNFKEHLTGRGFADALQDESAMRTLSSCLTFPLTLAYAFNLIFRDSPRHETKVLILGARAESSLPPVWWKDFLYINDRTAGTILKMNGPGLQPTKTNSKINTTTERVVNKSQPKGDVTLNWKVFDSSTAIDMKELLEDTGKFAVPSITVSHQFTTETTKLFHDRVDAMELLRWADVFVMYNPGIGSLPCGTQWEPTIRLLMQTRKPLVFTAFNGIDLDQDLAALDRISAEEDSQDVGGISHHIHYLLLSTHK